MLPSDEEKSVKTGFLLLLERQNLNNRKPLHVFISEVQLNLLEYLGLSVLCPRNLHYMNGARMHSCSTGSAPCLCTKEAAVKNFPLSPLLSLESFGRQNLLGFEDP